MFSILPTIGLLIFDIHIGFVSYNWYTLYSNRYSNEASNAIVIMSAISTVTLLGMLILHLYRATSETSLMKTFRLFFHRSLVEIIDSVN